MKVLIYGLISFGEQFCAEMSFCGIVDMCCIWRLGDSAFVSIENKFLALLFWLKMLATIKYFIQQA